MKFELSLKADLDNVTFLEPEDEEMRWFIKVKCTACGEEDGDEKYITSQEQHPMAKGTRGFNNFVMKCKFCGRANNSLDIVEGSLKSYNAEDAATFKSILTIEGRGLEVVAFSPKAGWCAQSSKSSSRYFNISLEDDWCDFDENAALPVGIYNVEASVRRVK